MTRIRVSQIQKIIIMILDCWLHASESHKYWKNISNILDCWDMHLSLTHKGKIFAKFSIINDMHTSLTNTGKIFAWFSIVDNTHPSLTNTGKKFLRFLIVFNTHLRLENKGKLSILGNRHLKLTKLSQKYLHDSRLMARVCVPIFSDTHTCFSNYQIIEYFHGFQLLTIRIRISQMQKHICMILDCWWHASESHYFNEKNIGLILDCWWHASESHEYK